MGFFDKLTDYVNTKGKDLDKSIKTFTAASKLQGSITEKEDQIAEALKTIGQMYYEAHVNDPCAEYAQQVTIISAAKAEIEKIRKELEALKGVQRCPNCGEQVSVQAAFCPKCGTKMPEAPVVTLEEKTAPVETVNAEVVPDADAKEVSAEEAARELNAAVEEVQNVLAEEQTKE